MCLPRLGRCRLVLPMITPGCLTLPNRATTRVAPTPHSTIGWGGPARGRPWEYNGLREMGGREGAGGDGRAYAGVTLKSVTPELKMNELFEGTRIWTGFAPFGLTETIRVTESLS